MKVYTHAEYDRLYRETLSYEQINFNLRGFDVVRVSKSQWDEGQYCNVNLSSGIRLEVIDEQILLNCNKKNEHNDSPIIVGKFYLNGYHSVICPGIDGIAPEYAETKGQNYLFYLPDIEEVEQSWQGDRLKMVRMEIDLAYIRNFATELSPIPKQLQALIENQNPQRFHFNVGGITTQMQTILQQIWQHPYQGAIARMYLEAKVLEILALQLSQLSESKPDVVSLALQSKNIDRVYQARG
ncbi:MAG: AraC family transcriptional regulator, partial [Cyanobacteria bacterium J06635_13]